MVVVKTAENAEQKRMMMNNSLYSEIKIKCLITEIEPRLDKNQKDYWIIRVQLDQFTTRNYLAFSTDYKLSVETHSLLTNDRQQLVNSWAVLTIQKKDDREKVVNIEVKK